MSWMAHEAAETAEAINAYANEYEAWVAQMIEDGAEPATLTDEAFADWLVGEWEGAAEDAMWKAGC